MTTVILTYPISLHPSDHVVGLNDSRSNSYFQAWDVHSLKHLSHLFDANIFFPARNSLAYSENYLGNLPIFAPFYLASNNPILGYNMVTLATFFVSFLTMYWLMKRMTGNVWAAAVAAFVYAFVPARIFQMERPHVISEQWAPLIVLFAWSYLEFGNQMTLIAFAGFLYLQILTSLHAGLFTLMIAFIYVATFAILRRKHLVWPRLGWLVASLLFVAIALLPVAVHYFGHQMEANSNYLDLGISATPGSYLNGGENHLYHRFLLRFVAPMWNDEKQLFFGFLPWALAAIGVAVYGIRPIKAALGEPRESMLGIRVLALASVVAILVGFVLSLGPYLQWDHHVSRISLPYLWLSKTLPGFKIMRVPTRFVFIVLFGVAILAGLGFQAMLNGLRRESGDRFWAKAAAATATLLWILGWEFSQVPLPAFYLGPVLEGHREYAWLAAQPPGSAIVELPTSNPVGRSYSQLLWEDEYMYASTAHWQPLINGNSSHFPAVYFDATAWAAKLPDPDAALELRKVGVRFIVVHTDQLLKAELARWQALPANSGMVKAVTIDKAIIYSLNNTQTPR